MFQVSILAQTEKFKVVLDAGHGGKDPGAIRYGLKEKDIALDVTLKVGALLAKASEIEVIYTRNTDVFIELGERPKIANKAKANLFVSIHCNSVDNASPYGTETFVMGFSKNKSNLEVAKKENSVIYLEEDYKVKYAGFNPNSPETMIGLKIAQEENRELSINIASKIQEGFTEKLKRFNRGVKEGALWVLHQSYMPSVLVELGFISNKNESEYLKSEKAQNELALVIAEAIIRYKREFYGGAVVNFIEEAPTKPQTKPEIVSQPTNPTPKPKVQQNTVPANNQNVQNNQVIYKVQIAASGTKVALEPKNFKGLSPISAIQEGNLYKYMFGEYNSIEEAREGQAAAKIKGYETTFIVAFKDGRKVNLNELKP
jgi:N-acetylmuramoyl-L-alanine amidase